jgi:hypothetical protein
MLALEGRSLLLIAIGRTQPNVKTKTFPSATVARISNMGLLTWSER